LVSDVLVGHFASAQEEAPAASLLSKDLCHPVALGEKKKDEFVRVNVSLEFQATLKSLAQTNAKIKVNAS